MSQFWVVGVPAAPQDVIASRNRFLESVSPLSEAQPFSIPNYLQVGTIDKLITLSDELSKVDPQFGTLCRKLKRTYDDIMVHEPPANLVEYQKQIQDAKTKKHAPKDTKVGPKPLYVTSGTTFDTGNSQGCLPKDFLQNFRWSEINYGSSTNVEKIKNEILNAFARTDDELKSSIATYNEAKNNIQNYEKRVNGNLLVRPIAQYIDPSTMHFTKHLTTVILAVPRSKEEEFLQQYEKIEFNYFEKVRLEEEKRAEQEAKDKAIRDEKEAALGKKSAAGIEQKKPILSKPEQDEEEEEKPPSDEEIRLAQAQAAKNSAENGQAKPEFKVKYTAHPQYGLTTDDKYKFVPTIVPGSALKIVGADQVPNDDLSLFRVICFKRYTADEIKQQEELANLIKHGTSLSTQQQQQLQTSINVEKFKSICRDYRWTVRPFMYDPREEELLKNEIQGYVDTRRSEWERLKTYCEEVFDTAYRAWIHIVAMRAFVEIRLRYGLGDNWLAFVVFPKKNTEKKIRDILSKLYTERGTESMLGSAEDGDYYPYVSLNVDLSDMM
jgi:hypothetical protein